MGINFVIFQGLFMAIKYYKKFMGINFVIFQGLFMAIK
jgi:hypothetical protein